MLDIVSRSVAEHLVRNVEPVRRQDNENWGGNSGAKALGEA